MRLLPVSFASGIGLLWRRTAALAARVLLASFVLTRPAMRSIGTQRGILAIAIILELVSIALFLTRQTAIAASLLVIGLTVLVVAVTKGRGR
jgi:hypothetical protein